MLSNTRSLLFSVEDTTDIGYAECIAYLLVFERVSLSVEAAVTSHAWVSDRKTRCFRGGASCRSCAGNGNRRASGFPLNTPELWQRTRRDVRILVQKLVSLEECGARTEPETRARSVFRTRTCAIFLYPEDGSGFAVRTTYANHSICLVRLKVCMVLHHTYKYLWVTCSSGV